MQILTHNPEIQTYSNEEGQFISSFLIGTKFNEAKWKINKRTGHNLVQKFVGKDFAIIPALINTPLSQGGGGHYFGQDTREDLLKGYAEHSHGKYVRIKGPYSYNDGTDDYYYNAVIKLRDSKAASALVDHGSNTWVPFAVSPHIWPIEGPDEDIVNWEPIGGALVIKGAYGPQAVISKLCKGTAAACEKSLAASSLCPTEDANVAERISSLVSKSASSQISMSESNKETTTATPTAPTPVVTELTKTTTTSTAAETVAKPNPTTTVESQLAVSNAPKIVTAEEFAASEKEKAELKKQVTQLLNDKRNSQINSVLNDFVGSTDEKTKTEFREKWFKKEIDVDILREFYLDIKNINTEKRKKASEEPEPGEEPEEPDNGGDPKRLKAKSNSKSASLRSEPEYELPKTPTVSKAGSVPVNKVREIAQFVLGEIEA